MLDSNERTIDGPDYRSIVAVDCVNNQDMMNEHDRFSNLCYHLFTSDNPEIIRIYENAVEKDYINNLFTSDQINLLTMAYKKAVESISNDFVAQNGRIRENTEQLKRCLETKTITQNTYYRPKKAADILMRKGINLRKLTEQLKQAGVQKEMMSIYIVPGTEEFYSKLESVRENLEVMLDSLYQKDQQVNAELTAD